jgi:hypothetical protein
MLIHNNNSPQVDMLLYSLSLFRADQSVII